MGELAMLLSILRNCADVAPKWTEVLALELEEVLLVLLAELRAALSPADDDDMGLLLVFSIFTGFTFLLVRQCHTSAMKMITLGGRQLRRQILALFLGLYLMVRACTTPLTA